MSKLFNSIPHQLLMQKTIRPNEPGYYVKHTDEWMMTPWKDYVDQVCAAAKSLIHLGVEFGQHVSILGINRPEWVIFDLAAMMIGAIPSGIYRTDSSKEVEYIINHSDSLVVLAENDEQWQKINSVRGSCPNLKKVVLMKGTSINDKLTIGWDDFMALGKSVNQDILDARLSRIKPTDVATMIYTSGTTGRPKAVMLSHSNIAWATENVQLLKNIQFYSTDRLLSYLPLSHIVEKTLSEFCAVSVGWSIYFAESIEKVPDNLKEVNPTIFFSVPRIWEKFYAGITEKLALAKGLKKHLAAMAQKTGRAVAEKTNRGESPTGFLKVKYKFFNKKVYTPLKQKLGLGETRYCVSGAAPLNQDLLGFFAGFGITILEGYGMSEDSCVSNINLPGYIKYGSVGKALSGLDVKIADDGEVLVKGPSVFMGYYKDEDKTNETLDDGWLKTGDLGEIDDEGFLSIVGRKKDIIITSYGKNVAPKEIENDVKMNDLVSECVIVGNNRKYITALVSVDEEKVTQFLTAEMDPSEVVVPIHLNTYVIEHIQRHIDAVNTNYSEVESIKKFKICDHQPSIETGELTATLKVKRQNFVKNFSTLVESMYEEKPIQTKS